MAPIRLLPDFGWKQYRGYVLNILDEPCMKVRWDLGVALSNLPGIQLRTKWLTLAVKRQVGICDFHQLGYLYLWPGTPKNGKYYGRETKDMIPITILTGRQIYRLARVWNVTVTKPDLNRLFIMNLGNRRETFCEQSIRIECRCFCLGADAKWFISQVYGMENHRFMRLTWQMIR